ncbi:MAG TPA: TAXI family TRAP transporter solute-binding subunit [Burkholderiales bacterium]|nr:TAXI family TRAP transporter solute-binding subunit [Burkholderiales bacterium]
MNFPRNEAGPRRIRLLAAAVLVAVLVGALLFLLFVRPAPPRSITMATGADGGAYQQFAERYRRILAQHGVELRLVATRGGVENLQKLNDPASGISVAFVQGGLTSEKESPDLVSLGTVFYEPVWIFVKGEFGKPTAGALKGKHVFLGPEGSGSRKLGLELIAALGMETSGMDIVDLPTAEVPAALRDGRLDIALVVASWESPVVHQLFAQENVSAISFPRADAHVALRPFLNKVTVPQGVADLRKNIPPADLVLVAPKTSIVARGDLHPALQYLLLEAAAQTHSAPGIFQKAGQFPSAEPIDLPLSDEARQYYRTGPPFLMRYLPFWMAIMVGRLLVVLIPVLGVLFPLVRLLPSTYGWYIRRRIFSLYGELKVLEIEMEAPSADRALLRNRLERLEARANHLRVPTMFTHFLYTLRAHIELVRGRLAQQPDR